MNTSYAPTLEQTDTDSQQQHIESNSNTELTTLEVQNEAGNIPAYVYNELGETITRLVLRGTGELTLCIDDRIVTVVPETKSVLIPIHSKPYIERWIRSPWKDAIANFENSFITVSVKPDPEGISERSTGLSNPDDIGLLSIHKTQKDSSLYNLTGILEDDAETLKLDKESTNKFSRVKSLVSAGLARGLPIDEGPVSEPIDINTLTPRQIIELYERMYKGPVTGEDFTGLSILGKNSTTGMSAEDASISNESGFTASILTPDKNLLKGILPENTSLIKAYVGPIIPLINEAIAAFNNETYNNCYTQVDTNEPTGTLLYKRFGRTSWNPETLKNNLTPLVLSPDVVVLRGYRGFTVDTLVLINIKGEWVYKFFPDSGRVENFGSVIDSWVDKIEGR